MAFSTSEFLQSLRSGDEEVVLLALENFKSCLTSTGFIPTLTNYLRLSPNLNEIVSLFNQTRLFSNENALVLDIFRRAVKLCNGASFQTQASSLASAYFSTGLAVCSVKVIYRYNQKVRKNATVGTFHRTLRAALRTLVVCGKVLPGGFEQIQKYMLQNPPNEGHALFMRTRLVYKLTELEKNILRKYPRDYRKWTPHGEILRFLTKLGRTSPSLVLSFLSPVEDSCRSLLSPKKQENAQYKALQFLRARKKRTDFKIEERTLARLQLLTPSDEEGMITSSLMLFLVRFYRHLPALTSRSLVIRLSVVLALDWGIHTQRLHDMALDVAASIPETDETIAKLVLSDAVSSVFSLKSLPGHIRLLRVFFGGVLRMGIPHWFNTRSPEYSNQKEFGRFYHNTLSSLKLFPITGWDQKFDIMFVGEEKHISLEGFRHVRNSFRAINAVYGSRSPESDKLFTATIENHFLKIASFIQKVKNGNIRQIHGNERKISQFFRTQRSGILPFPYEWKYVFFALPFLTSTTVEIPAFKHIQDIGLPVPGFDELVGHAVLDTEENTQPIPPIRLNLVENHGLPQLLSVIRLADMCLEKHISPDQLYMLLSLIAEIIELMSTCLKTVSQWKTEQYRLFRKSISLGSVDKVAAMFVIEMFTINAMLPIPGLRPVLQALLMVVSLLTERYVFPNPKAGHVPDATGGDGQQAPPQDAPYQAKSPPAADAEDMFDFGFDEFETVFEETKQRKPSPRDAIQRNIDKSLAKTTKEPEIPFEEKENPETLSTDFLSILLKIFVFGQRYLGYWSDCLKIPSDFSDCGMLPFSGNGDGISSFLIYSLLHPVVSSILPKKLIEERDLVLRKFLSGCQDTTWASSCFPTELAWGVTNTNPFFIAAQPSIPAFSEIRTRQKINREIHAHKKRSVFAQLGVVDLINEFPNFCEKGDAAAVESVYKVIPESIINTKKELNAIVQQNDLGIFDKTFDETFSETFSRPVSEGGFAADKFFKHSLCSDSVLAVSKDFLQSSFALADLSRPDGFLESLRTHLRLLDTDKNVELLYNNPEATHILEVKNLVEYRDHLIDNGFTFHQLRVEENRIFSLFKIFKVVGKILASQKSEAARSSNASYDLHGGLLLKWIHRSLFVPDGKMRCVTVFLFMEFVENFLVARENKYFPFSCTELSAKTVDAPLTVAMIRRIIPKLHELKDKNWAALLEKSKFAEAIDSLCSPELTKEASELLEMPLKAVARTPEFRKTMKKSKNTFEKCAGVVCFLPLMECTAFDDCLTFELNAKQTSVSVSSILEMLVPYLHFSPVQIAFSAFFSDERHRSLFSGLLQTFTRFLNSHTDTLSLTATSHVAFFLGFVPAKTSEKRRDSASPLQKTFRQIEDKVRERGLFSNIPVRETTIGYLSKLLADLKKYIGKKKLRKVEKTLASPCLFEARLEEGAIDFVVVPFSWVLLVCFEAKTSRTDIWLHRLMLEIEAALETRGGAAFNKLMLSYPSASWGLEATGLFKKTKSKKKFTSSRISKLFSIDEEKRVFAFPTNPLKLEADVAEMIASEKLQDVVSPLVFGYSLFEYLSKTVAKSLRLQASASRAALPWMAAAAETKNPTAPNFAQQKKLFSKIYPSDFRLFLRERAFKLYPINTPLPASVQVTREYIMGVEKTENLPALVQKHTHLYILQRPFSELSIEQLFALDEFEWTTCKKKFEVYLPVFVYQVSLCDLFFRPVDNLAAYVSRNDFVPVGALLCALACPLCMSLRDITGLATACLGLALRLFVEFGRQKSEKIKRFPSGKKQDSELTEADYQKFKEIEIKEKQLEREKIRAIIPATIISDFFIDRNLCRSSAIFSPLGLHLLKQRRESFGKIALAEKDERPEGDRPDAPPRKRAPEGDAAQNPKREERKEGIIHFGKFADEIDLCALNTKAQPFVSTVAAAVYNNVLSICSTDNFLARDLSRSFATASGVIMRDNITLLYFLRTSSFRHTHSVKQQRNVSEQMRYFLFRHAISGCKPLFWTSEADDALIALLGAAPAVSAGSSANVASKEAYTATTENHFKALQKRGIFVPVNTFVMRFKNGFAKESDYVQMAYLLSGVNAQSQTVRVAMTFIKEFDLCYFLRILAAATSPEWLQLLTADVICNFLQIFVRKLGTLYKRGMRHVHRPIADFGDDLCALAHEALGTLATARASMRVEVVCARLAHGVTALERLLAAMGRK
eukprot:gnl/Chilomastix_cuspidata/1992.p1 GENE.gnl/Chilomastix_cuspidata/1992~~gnl/Chilomastix_cuspidata/1992.p1  ORF type:complete len:2214 (+),score=473.92 gnl/Chilomastix_cuspidata/1992:52-6642(+)